MSETSRIHKAGFVEGVEQLYTTPVLETLLMDRTTGKHIIWADDEYEALGVGYQGADEITLDKITGTYSGVIKPRVAKEREKQTQRTRNHAEVFTPSWLCNRMNNYMDADWFGREDVFNRMYEIPEGSFLCGGLARMEEAIDNVPTKHVWEATEDPIEFPEGKTWQEYTLLPKLEITCGEAPFICSRYDTVNGEILPVHDRIGFLDRKLRIVTENTESYDDWIEWAFKALQSTYGYEFQGDNLFIARFNVIQTIDEHKLDVWDGRMSDEEALKAAEIISWNIWQMDGLKGTVPSDLPVSAEQLKLLGEEDYAQMALFELDEQDPEQETAPFCLIYDWQENKSQEYISLRDKG